MPPLDPHLVERLREAGVDPAAGLDPADAWRLLHRRFGARATLLDRYALEAFARGIETAALSPQVKRRSAFEVVRASWPGFEWADGTGGDSTDPIEVTAFDPRWVARFADLRNRLAAALGASALRIDHVGSTAVPGLASKPVIDVQVVVADLEAEAAYVPRVESVGLALRSRDALHRYFRPAPPKPRDVHVHVCPRGGGWERDHLLFRDYLRAHAEEAADYGRLKSALAVTYRDDRLAYTDAKTDFILDALAAANAWAAHTGWTVPR